MVPANYSDEPNYIIQYLKKIPITFGWVRLALVLGTGHKRKSPEILDDNVKQFEGAGITPGIVPTPEVLASLKQESKALVEIYEKLTKNLLREVYRALHLGEIMVGKLIPGRRRYNSVGHPLEDYDEEMSYSLNTNAGKLPSQSKPEKMASDASNTDDMNDEKSKKRPKITSDENADTGDGLQLSRSGASVIVVEDDIDEENGVLLAVIFPNDMIFKGINDVFRYRVMWWHGMIQKWISHWTIELKHLVTKKVQFWWKYSPM
ncbi:uncharacterized protein EAF02_010725 [Botrytis sinoallii]|uniref:uncharacterized protein n=1 Tax=Botrytis sinoallii TaxID=1463999 RepID=UPI0019000C95|nr:uncharacterized protein EAF02_010725 [Botrytis sinoallii]KAF7860491.1 hypothetical protein EAF02_010725 [Botrytis sinoallii]